MTTRLSPFMNNLSWKYCEKVLPRVSRTFALNIKVLTGDHYRAVLLGYLGCRIIDTIEDSPSLKPPLKVQFLRQFPEMIKGDRWEKQLKIWVNQLFKENLIGQPSDIELVKHTSHVLSCFKKLSPSYQHAGEKMFTNMSHGMAEYIESSSSGHMALKDLDDLKQYCYYVAGVVGEFLYESFELTYKIADSKKKILKDHCIDFGLGLQMTNIAKDILKDHQRGERFLPESFLQEVGLTKEQFLNEEESQKNRQAHNKLLKEAHAHLLRGYLFTKTLHRRHFRLRLFCIWPLWMAFETLKTLHAHPNFLHSDRDVKISRSQVKKILFSTSLMISSNHLIEKSLTRHYSNMFSQDNL